MCEHVINLLLLPDLKTHLEIARANAVIPVPLRLSQASLLFPVLRMVLESDPWPLPHLELDFQRAQTILLPHQSPIRPFPYYLREHLYSFCICLAITY